MLKSKSFLAVDFGAGSLKLAEFEINEAGGLRLKNYQVKALGPEGAQESTREATVQKALQEVLAAIQTSSKIVNVCAPGFHVFSKFVKLPKEAGIVPSKMFPPSFMNSKAVKLPNPREDCHLGFDMISRDTSNLLSCLIQLVLPLRALLPDQTRNQTPCNLCPEPMAHFDQSDHHLFIFFFILLFYLVAKFKSLVAHLLEFRIFWLT